MAFLFECIACRIQKPKQDQAGLGKARQGESERGKVRQVKAQQNVASDDRECSKAGDCFTLPDEDQVSLI